MHPSSTIAGNKNICFFFGGDRVPIEIFSKSHIATNYSSTAARKKKFRRVSSLIDFFFRSPMHRSSTVVRNENTFFRWRSSIDSTSEFSSVLCSSTIAGNENIYFFGDGKMPTEFVPSAR